jgi:hypothetical protein
MTRRHNSVQLKVVETIMEYRKLKREQIHENNDIRMNEE